MVQARGSGFCFWFLPGGGTTCRSPWLERDDCPGVEKSGGEGRGIHLLYTWWSVMRWPPVHTHGGAIRGDYLCAQWSREGGCSH